MTDRPRRSSDTKIDQLLALQEIHMTDYHANLEPGEAQQYVNRVDQMERGFEELHTTNKRMLIILDGEEELNASGEITRVGGISKDVVEVKVDVAELKVAVNGGKLGVKTLDKILIIVANGFVAAIAVWIAANA